MACRLTFRSIKNLLMDDYKLLFYGSSSSRWNSGATQEQAQTKVDSEEKQRTAHAEEQAQVEDSADFKKLVLEKEKLSKELEESKDKYMRALAETENTRIRLQKQVADAKEFGIQAFCKDLLEVADILSTAVDSVTSEQLQREQQGSALCSLHEGVALTQRQLRVVFSRHGVQVIDPALGDKFDPHLHEALFQAPAQEGCAPGSIAVVQKVGYGLKTRTLRPALVGVVKE